MCNCCKLQTTATSETRRRNNNTLIYRPSLFLLVLIYLLCTLSVQAVNGAPITKEHSLHRRSPYSRQLCEHHASDNALKCSFHDTCIESIYRCGGSGFSLGYAQPRCKAVRLMRASNNTCQHCLKNRQLVDWVLKTETCLQPKLQVLAQRQVGNMSIPDPQDCLSFEEESFQALSSCYQQHHMSLCSILSSASSDIKTDLLTIVSGLSVSPYYKPLVMEQFHSLIEGCGNSVLAQEVSPSPPTRVLFCVVENRGARTTTDTRLRKLAQELNKPLEQFSVANSNMYDDTIDTECDSLSPTYPSEAVVSLRKGFNLIQWTPTDSSLANNLRDHYIQSLDNSIAKLIFYKYNIYATQCGNGIREAGEQCDMFGDNGQDRYGCTSDCTIDVGYECRTNQLRLSQCYNSVCGDGKRTSDEDCDDGNTVSSDGCSSSCKIESDYSCSQVYNITSICHLEPKPSSTTTLPLTSSSSSSSSSSPTSVTPVSSTSLPSSSSLPRPDPSMLGVTSSSCSVRTTLWSVVLPILIVAGYLLLSDLLNFR